MANNLSAGIKEVWDTVYQVTHHKVPVYPAISNFRLQAQLEKGDTVHREYRSELVAKDMGNEGQYTRQDITDTDETLVISYVKETSFYIKKLDQIQNHLPVAMKYAEDASVAIFNQIDADVLGTYDQFSQTLDAGDLGGSAGQGIVVTTSNIQKLFSNSSRLLIRANIRVDQTAKFTGVKIEDSKKQMGVAAISPDVYMILIEKLADRETALGDKIGIQGHGGNWMGYQLFVSNSLGWSGTLGLATNPTADDTITINGVTFVFKATPANPGEVDIGGNAAASLANLVAAINNANGYAPGAGSATAYFEVTYANRKLLNNIVATGGVGVINIKAKGHGFVPVADDLTDGTDGWVTTSLVQHNLIGVANAIDVVIQKTPDAMIQSRDGYVGKDVVTWAAYGIKVFHESQSKMIDVWVSTANF